MLLKIVYLLTCRYPAWPSWSSTATGRRMPSCWCSGTRTRCCAGTPADRLVATYGPHERAPPQAGPVHAPLASDPGRPRARCGHRPHPTHPPQSASPGTRGHTERDLGSCADYRPQRCAPPGSLPQPRSRPGIPGPRPPHNSAAATPATDLLRRHVPSQPSRSEVTTACSPRPGLRPTDVPTTLIAGRQLPPGDGGTHGQPTDK